LLAAAKATNLVAMVELAMHVCLLEA